MYRKRRTNEEMLRKRRGEPPPPPTPSPVRFKIERAYAPAEKVARRLCLTLAQFKDCAPSLYARAFPLPHQTTGMYDLEGIDR